MKKVIISLLLAISLTAQADWQKSPADLVNPLAGTQSSFAISTGNTYPAIALPWGMNFWMPLTGTMGNGWAYVYTDEKIRGFKQTHQPSPWINDYGQFAVMPTTGKAEMHQDRRASWFSHKAEEAKPYYYKVYLADYDVTAEMAPTERACMMRVTYPETHEARYVVDAFDKGSYLKVVDSQTVIGYTTRNSGGVPANFKNYFVLKFDHDFQSAQLMDVKQKKINERHTDDYGVINEVSGKELQADHAGLVITFPAMKRGEQVNVRMASSFISFDQALLNLNELGDRSFNEVKAAGKQRWNEVLGRIEVDDDNIDHLRTFYSCFYRSVLFPRDLAETDAEGKVVHYSPHTGEVCPGHLFTDTGFWDTFRCLFPFVNMLFPSMAQKMQEGWANVYKESGFLPEWSSPGHRGCMVGNNSASVVADAYLQGLRGYDAETLWKAVTHGANAVHPEISSTGRCGYDYYNRLGYVPYDVNIKENVARTLEYAYDDWCIYQFGKALGKSEKELAQYKKNLTNYKNVFNRENNLMRGRLQNGEFQSPFSPLKWGDAFTEGNSWHYSWSVFHDPQGLINLMGGNETFNAMLDSVFNVPPLFDDSYYGQVIHEIREMQIMNMGNYAHGNQPIQHMIYLYGYSGQPWKTQYWIRETMDRLYSSTPDAYCGDEDNGQTSAWYVFSAMGFYPVCPGSNQYVLGVPYFKNMRVHLENGNTLNIEADANCSCRRYVQSMEINGQPWDNNYLTTEQVQAGGTISYKLGKEPNTQRGTSASAVPYSWSNSPDAQAPTKGKKGKK